MKPFVQVLTEFIEHPMCPEDIKLQALDIYFDILGLWVSVDAWVGSASVVETEPDFLELWSPKQIEETHEPTV